MNEELEIYFRVFKCIEKLEGSNMHKIDLRVSSPPFAPQSSPKPYTEAPSERARGLTQNGNRLPHTYVTEFSSQNHSYIHPYA